MRKKLVIILNLQIVQKNIKNYKCHKIVIFLLILSHSNIYNTCFKFIFQIPIFLMIYQNFGTLFQLIFSLVFGYIFLLISITSSFLGGYFKFIFISLQSVTLYLVFGKLFPFIFPPLFSSIFLLFLLNSNILGKYIKSSF